MQDTYYVTKGGMPINPAYIKDNGERTIFKPFIVKDTMRLADALRRGKISKDSELLLIELNNGAIIALSREQMAYHHVAQGEINGEPWLVSF